MTPAFNGDIAPISDYVPKSEWSNWIGTQENMWNGKLWAMPIYLLGSPHGVEQADVPRGGPEPRPAADELSAVAERLRALKAKGITPIVVGNKDGLIGSSILSWSGKGDLAR